MTVAIVRINIAANVPGNRSPGPQRHRVSG
jgi:hypothetical protein